MGHTKSRVLGLWILTKNDAPTVLIKTDSNSLFLPNDNAVERSPFEYADFHTHLCTFAQESGKVV